MTQKMSTFSKTSKRKKTRKNKENNLYRVPSKLSQDPKLKEVESQQFIQKIIGH